MSYSTTDACFRSLKHFTKYPLSQIEQYVAGWYMTSYHAPSCANEKSRAAALAFIEFLMELYGDRLKIEPLNEARFNKENARFYSFENADMRPLGDPFIISENFFRKGQAIDGFPLKLTLDCKGMEYRNILAHVTPIRIFDERPGMVKFICKYFKREMDFEHKFKLFILSNLMEVTSGEQTMLCYNPAIHNRRIMVNEWAYVDSSTFRKRLKDWAQSSNPCNDYLLK